MKHIFVSFIPKLMRTEGLKSLAASLGMMLVIHHFSEKATLMYLLTNVPHIII